MTTAIKEMKPTYKIFVLESEEYDSLHKHYPMKKEDLEGSLGFAYGKTKEAFVRRTNVPEWDEETILHEAEELLAKHSTHEDENNIRWKKGKDIFSNIIPLVVGGIVTALTGGGAAPFVGPTMASILGGAASAGTSAVTQKNMSSAGTISPLTTALSGVGSGLMGKGIISGVNVAKGAGGGILGQTLSGIQGAVGITPGAAKAPGTAGSPIQANPIYVTPGATMQEAMTPAQQAAAASGSTFGKITSSLGSSAIPNILGSSIGSGISSTLAPSAAGTQGAGQVGTQAGSQTGKSVLGKLGEIATKPETILGGAALLGSQAPKTPQFQMPSYVSDLQSKLMAGQSLSPLGQQARTSLSEILKSTPQELYPTANDAYYNAALRRTRESYAEAEKQLDAAYNVAGVYGSGEHLAEKAKLKEQLARTESDLAANVEQRRFELARTTQYQAIQDSLGVDRDTMDDIAGLTALDVETAAMMYGARVEDVKSIRENLGTLGVELLLKGQGEQKQKTDEEGGGLINKVNQGVAGTVKNILGQ